MMFTEPPNGQYRKDFQVGDLAYTVDRKIIGHGLRVFTNNLDTGWISLDRAEWKWHAGEKKYHLWFDVIVDTDYNGNKLERIKRVMQSDDRVTTVFQGQKA